MRRVILILCIISALFPLSGEGTTVPTDAEVRVSLQSILVALASHGVSQRLITPINFEHSSFICDATYASCALHMDHADVGLLRKLVLDSPNLSEKPMGFFEALLRSMIPFDYQMMITYLKAQGLGLGEVFFTGSLNSFRLSTPYPFRYEGKGEILVSGSRFSEPFLLHFSFVVPLEGPHASSIIPTKVQAQGQDYMHVARALFPTRVTF